MSIRWRTNYCDVKNVRQMKKSDLATRWRGILGLIGTLAIFNRWEAQVEELRKDLPEKFKLLKI